MRADATLARRRPADRDAGELEPASAAERMLWFTEQLVRGTAGTVALAHVRLDGPVDVPALRLALEAVRRRHPALRTAFTASAGRLLRRAVEDPPALDLLALAAGTDRRAAVRAFCAEPYDLAAGDVLRAGLVRDGEGADLYLAPHHVAFDGYSEVIVADELATAYGRILAGEEPDLAELPRLPALELCAERRAELTAYWRGALGGVGDLPAGTPAQTHRQLLRDSIVERPLHIGAADVRVLKGWAREHAVSAFAVLLTAAGRALADLGGGSDFCVGTPFSTRRRGQEAEVCCELNVLPVRLRDLAAPDAVARAWDTLIDAQLHADLPLTDIIACRPPGEPGRMPVYQALVAYQNWPRAVHRAGPARLRTLPVGAFGPPGEVVIEFYAGADELTGFVQAPSAGAWAHRLDELAAATCRHVALATSAGPRPGMTLASDPEDRR